MAYTGLARFAYLLYIAQCLLSGRASASKPESTSQDCRNPSSAYPLRYHRHEGNDCPAPVTDKVGPDPRDWAPWTHRPYCAGTDYCVYTNSLFHGGVSFIATPERAALSLATLAPMLLNRVLTEPNNASLPPPFEMRDMPGRGKGLVATRRLAAGETIMIDYPRFIADTQFPQRTQRAKGQQLLERGAEQLADPGSVWNLARSSKSNESHPVEDVLRTNSFAATIDEKEFMGLFPRVARINHACNPNALTRFSEHSLSTTVRAIRGILQGEEITISYTDFGLTRPERQDRLQQNWGFRCACALCSAPAADTTASDARRLRIRTLQGELARELRSKAFRSAIQLNHELLGLLAEEQLLPHLGEHYHVMARLYLAARDAQNARKYSQLALEDLDAYGGPDTDDVVGELRELLRTL